MSCSIANYPAETYNDCVPTVIALIIGLVVIVGLVAFTQQSPTPQDSPDAEQTETTQQPRGVPALTALDRSGRNLREMPKDIFGMTQLQKIDLSHNQITGALPAEIRHLKNLEVLNISNNEMTGLPAELGQLSKLHVLNASNNRLTGIPHELGNLQNLEMLDLSGNDISEQDLQIIRSRLPSSTHILH